MPEPLVFAARRPVPGLEAAAEQKEPALAEPPAATTPEPTGQVGSVPPPARRSARIVAAPARDDDARLRERERLLARVLASDGRSAITRAASEYRRAGFEFPLDQAIQLQLLEHLDEAEVRAALVSLGAVLCREPPLKRPVLEQRLRRLEDTADEEATRAAAADLRRMLRA